MHERSAAFAPRHLPARSLSHATRPTPIAMPSGETIFTMSSFSNSPSTRQTPTGSRLVASGRNKASYAPSLICNSPLAKPSL